MARGDRGPRAPGFPYDAVVDAHEVGMDPVALAATAQRFRAQHAAGRFPGGQLVVRRHGRKVLDVALGTARGHRRAEGGPPTPVAADTRFPVFSAGKPVVALAVALLEERGLLDIDAPVARYVPGFERNGKERITVRDILTHRGGLLMPDLVRALVASGRWGAWDDVIDAIAEARPGPLHGTLAYHPFEYGWILAEVVRRVSGLPLDQFVERDIAKPLGLPQLRFGAREGELSLLARSYFLGTGPAVVAGLDLAPQFEAVNNSREFLTALVPGAGLITDAATLAALYDQLLDEQNGLFQPWTIRRYTERQVMGWCRSNRAPLAFGLGFILGTLGPSVYGWWGSATVFGHAGAFCAVAFGDWRTGVAAAIVTNGNAGQVDVVRRFPSLAHAIRNAAL